MPNAPMTLTLIGGPTLLIEVGGYRLLTDPTFDQPGEYASGAIKLEKQTGPALPAASLEDVHAVLLSHDQHADNLDPAGREFLRKVPVVFTTRVGAERLGRGAIGLSPWQGTLLHRAEANPLLVTAAPARHGPVGVEPMTGEVTGFLLGIEKPGDLVYLTGDTVWYDGVAEVARRCTPGLVVPFAGSARTRGAFHLTMDANDVIETAAAFPYARIAPIHTDGWRHFTETGEDLTHALEAFGLGDRLLRLVPGVPATIQL